MFNITQFIDVSDGMPGMLIPLFSSNGTNLPYVQEMDEFFQVEALVPFLEYENYPLLSADRSNSINVNDQGLIAFRSTDSEIICEHVKEILNYIENNKEKISASPVLQCQLQRIEAANLSTSYDVWNEVSRGVFKGDAQRRLWMNSEIALFQRQTQIWSEIGSRRNEKERLQSGLSGALNRFSTEYLVRWLSNRDNFVYRDWTKIWHYVNEGSPFDARLLEVAQRWLIASQADGGDLNEARTILFAIFHYAKFSKFDFTELGRFLSAEFHEKPYAALYFLRPAKLFENLLWFLSSFGEIEEVLDFALFCTDGLPMEQYIQTALFDALKTLFARPEITYEESILCQNLLMEIEKY